MEINITLPEGAEYTEEEAKQAFDEKALIEQYNICKQCYFFNECAKKPNDGNHCSFFKEKKI